MVTKTFHDFIEVTYLKNSLVSVNAFYLTTGDTFYVKICLIILDFHIFFWPVLNDIHWKPNL